MKRLVLAMVLFSLAIGAPGCKRDDGPMEKTGEKIDEAVAAAGVLDAALRRARAVAACAPEAVRLMKRSLYDGAGWDPRSAARAEAFAQAATMRTDDAREGIRAPPGTSKRCRAPRSRIRFPSSTTLRAGVACTATS